MLSSSNKQKEEKMNLLNLTPHAISIVVNGETTTIQPSGTIARVAVNAVKVAEFNGVPVMANEYGEVEGLPENKTPILVSAMVLGQLGSEWRNIAFAPDTGKTAIRNEQGHIVAVTQLVTV